MRYLDYNTSMKVSDSGSDVQPRLPRYFLSQDSALVAYRFLHFNCSD